MKVLLILLLFLSASFSGAQTNTDVYCSPVENHTTQTISMHDNHVQCDNICSICMAIQTATPSLELIKTVSVTYASIGVHYYFLSEPILNPPPITYFL